jgi:hypothetical protein
MCSPQGKAQQLAKVNAALDALRQQQEAGDARLKVRGGPVPHDAGFG